MRTKTTIIIVDDHPLFLEGIKSTLAKEEDITIIGEACNVDEAINLIIAKKPDIALLDIEIKDRSGFDIAAAIRKKAVDTKIIFLTMYNDVEILNKALAMGVKGFILKEHTSSEIIECIRNVANGKTYISPLLSDAMISVIKLNQKKSDTEILLNKLTLSEKRILKLISLNKTSKEIAEELNVSPKTVENHRNNISDKLNLHGTHSLIKFALDNKSSM